MEPKVIKAVFGKRISKNYFLVEIIVANDTDKTVRIENAAFRASRAGLVHYIVPIIHINLFAFDLDNKHRGRLAEIFDLTCGVIPKRSQKRTLVFMPQKLFNSANPGVLVSARQVMSQLGQLVLTIEEFDAGNRVKLVSP